MKILYTIILALCAIYAYSQEGQQNKNDGVYLFQKATLTTYNYNSKAEINTRIIEDVTLIDSTDIFLQNIVLKAIIYNGVLSFCILPDHREYVVRNEVILIPAKEGEEHAKSNNPKELFPYTSSFDNNTLTFTSEYLYGNPTYEFPLENKLAIILTKEK
ncbi:hypothetical protein CLV62_101207 [Dysgonomonas alginatilytica]|uniref:Uncharacterized protein n=1 Tax=Dysgonomonas alginatilytica TaxID=1605892 RepID=A0A2V3PVT7_9BACT|nr:hypothetical protein [Dysgonomonas alginatilytica]PXV68941.1 hypothetical protein CLV62_101207 [Dysgonomonas alginatilytica]